MTVQSRQLWDAWRDERDGRAFQALVRSEMPHVLAVARRAGCDAARSEDVLQETLTALAIETSDLPLEIGLRVWLVRTARDRAHSRLRSDRRRKVRETRAARPEASLDADSAGVRDSVEAALATLPEAGREVLLLRFLHDLDYRDIATVLGVPESAVRVRVHRALERLRARFGPSAGTLLAAIPLPLVVGEARLLDAAVSSGLAHAAATTSAGTTAASSAAAATTTGVLTMATTTQKALLVGVAIASGALGIVGGQVLTEGGAGSSQPSSVAAEGRPTAADGDAVRTRRARSGSASAEPRANALEKLGDELRVSADEVAFIRRALVAERERLERASFSPDTTAIDILEKVFDHGADARAIVADHAAFASRVAAPEGSVHRVIAESTAEITEVDGRDLPETLNVLEFGPGRFKLSWRGWVGRLSRDAGHFAIRGAGMRKTTVELSDEITVIDKLSTLVVSDVTIDGGSYGNELIDVRGSAAVRLERVRFQHWMSAGYSAPVGFAGRAYVAVEDCEFIGGPGHAAMAVRGGGLASFNRCRFLDLSNVIGVGEGVPKASTVALRDCVFDNSGLSGWWKDGVAPYPVQIMLQNAEVFHGDGRQKTSDARDFWGAKYVAEMGPMTFAPAKPRSTIGDLLELLKGLHLRNDEQCLSISLKRRDGDGGREYVVDIAELTEDRKLRGGRVLRATLAADGTVSAQPFKGGNSNRANTGSLIDKPKLRDLLVRASLDADITAEEAHYKQSSTREGTFLALRLGKAWVLDAATGRVIQRPVDWSSK